VFDLIFEDYHIKNRSPQFTYDLKTIKESGILVVDDAHLDSVGSILGPYFRKGLISINYLKGLEDNYGRYPAIIKRK